MFSWVVCLPPNNNCGAYKSFIRDLVATEDTQFDLISSEINLNFKFLFLQPPFTPSHNLSRRITNIPIHSLVKLAKFQIILAI